MKILNKLFIIIIIFNTTYSFAEKISNYRIFYASCYINNSSSPEIAIRKFTKNKNEYFLLVNPSSLQTTIAEISEATYSETNLFEIRMKFSNSGYIKALMEAEKNSTVIQNAGITHFPFLKKGAFITADLCPSVLPLDRNFFNILTNQFSKMQKAVPIGLCIAGIWMEKHPDEIKWLISLSEKGLISITWINHSYHHKTAVEAQLTNNFLLTPGTDIDAEVLNTEKKMIELGIKPSVFFRFPGLISNADVFLKITSFGLVPIGSNAWLAKNQWPDSGSIILVHANGNEPLGISRFMELLETKSNDIIKKDWIFYELREGIIPGNGNE